MTALESRLFKEKAFKRNNSRGRDIVDVVAQRDKEVEEKWRSAIPHLKLHRAATLEGAAAPDDERKVVGPQLRVRVGRVGIGVPRGCKYSAALDSGLYKPSIQVSNKCFELQVTSVGTKLSSQNLRSPCFRSEIFFNSSSPYFSPAQYITVSFKISPSTLWW